MFAQICKTKFGVSGTFHLKMHIRMYIDIYVCLCTYTYICIFDLLSDKN